MVRRSKRMARKRGRRSGSSTSAAGSLPPLRGDSLGRSVSRGESPRPSPSPSGPRQDGRAQRMTEGPELPPHFTSQSPRGGGRRRGSRQNCSPPPQPRGGQEAPGTFSFGAMAQLLAGTGPRDNFRAPTYSGDGDVELFLGQFSDIAVANRWGEQAALLHLRSHLEGTARACGAGQSRDRVEDALRARFGLSQRQARDRLVNLKRDSKATLHE